MTKPNTDHLPLGNFLELDSAEDCGDGRATHESQAQCLECGASRGVFQAGFLLTQSAPIVYALCGRCHQRRPPFAPRERCAACGAAPRDSQKGDTTNA